jgi:haloalkane dehalogenase
MKNYERYAVMLVGFLMTTTDSFSQQTTKHMTQQLTFNHELYPFESKWMDINGSQVHYIDEGIGPVIMFSHAVVGSSFMYREFVKELRSHYRVIIPDYPGFGLSQPAPDYRFTFVEQANIFLALIEKLHLDDITLIAHDSPSGLLVAAWKPKLFRAFVLTDTQIFPSDEYEKIHKLVNMAGGNFFQRFNVATNFLTWGTLKFGMPSKRFSKAEKKEYYNMTKGKIRRQAPGKILRSIRTEREFMVQIKTAFETLHHTKPILMIYGRNDPVNQLGIPQRMQRMFANSELHIIEKEKHFPHEGQGKLMSLIIFKWMDGIKIRPDRQFSVEFLRRGQ